MFCCFASRSTVSKASTTSPRCPSSPPLGKDSTLVAASLPPHWRFSACISASPVSRIAISPAMFGAAARNAAKAACVRRSSPTFAPSQASDWRTISISSCGLAVTSLVPLRLGPPSAISLIPLRRGLVGGDDLADELAPNHVFLREGDMRDVLDAFQDRDRLNQPGIFSERQIDLRGIAGHDHLAAFAQ